MWLLSVDDSKCTWCGMCAVIFPNFANAGRRLPISKTAPEDAEWREQADALWHACANDAIEYKAYKPPPN